MADDPEVQGDNNQTQAAGSGETSTGKQETSFTQADMDKFRNDGLAAAGRDARSIETDRAALVADREGFAADRKTWEEQRDATETTLYKDEPDKFRALQADRAARDSAANLEKRKADLQTEEARVAEREKVVAQATREALAEAISPGHKDLLLELGGPDEASMRRFAKALAPAQNGASNGDTPTPDSGQTAGEGKPSLDAMGSALAVIVEAKARKNIT